MKTYITQQHIPYVPIAVGVPLVTAAPLAAKLASSAPELMEVPRSTFEETRTSDLKMLDVAEIDAEALRAVLDLYVLNMQALFSLITTSLQLRGQFEQLVAETEVKTTDALNRIEGRRLLLIDAESEARQIAKDLDLPKELYTNDCSIDPAALFEACLFRLNYWQEKWEEQCLKTIKLDLKSQNDAVLSAVADCLVALCEEGINDFISFDPTPRVQEDVYLALYSAIEHPFSGTWPKIVTQTLPATADLVDGGFS